MANGRPLGAMQTVKIGSDIVVQVGRRRVLRMPRASVDATPRRLELHALAPPNLAHRAGIPAVQHLTSIVGPAVPACLLQASPVKAGRPSGVIVSLPYLRIRAAQREAYKQGQAQPSWGSWLDVYLTVLAPLPAPVGGILGESHPLPPWSPTARLPCSDLSHAHTQQTSSSSPSHALPKPMPAGRTYTPAQAAAAAGSVASQAGGPAGAMPMASFEFQVQQ